MAAQHECYRLQVTAGPSYDAATHSPVPVNAETPLVIASPHLTAELYVRIQDFRSANAAPATSPYFADPSQARDRYSIAFDFALPAESAPIAGPDLVFGNDFDHPIRDQLPPLFDTAFRAVRYWVDPGLAGDVYADQPWLCGPLLSSMNVLQIGGYAGEQDAECASEAVEPRIYTEGSVPGTSRADVRAQLAMPADARQRQRHFLAADRLASFAFEPGRSTAAISSIPTSTSTTAWLGRAAHLHPRPLGRPAAALGARGAQSGAD